MSGEERVPSGGKRPYGSAEHAAKEALDQWKYSTEGFTSADNESVAEVVVSGLRERGFMVTQEPRCECGWTGGGNHYHDNRMGRTTTDDTKGASDE